MKRVLMFMVLVLTQTLFSANYYVATNGSDSNDGSIGSPWKTIKYAVEKACELRRTGSPMLSHDVIKIDDGVYTENEIYIDNPSDYIVIEGSYYDNSSVIIQPADTVKVQGQIKEKMFITKNTPKIILKNLTFRGLGSESNLIYNSQSFDDEVEIENCVIKESKVVNGLVANAITRVKLIDCDITGNYLGLTEGCSVLRIVNGVYDGNIQGTSVNTGLLQTRDVNTLDSLYLSGNVIIRNNEGPVYTSSSDKIYVNFQGGSETILFENNMTNQDLGTALFSNVLSDTVWGVTLNENGVGDWELFDFKTANEDTLYLHNFKSINLPSFSFLKTGSISNLIASRSVLTNNREHKFGGNIALEYVTLAQSNKTAQLLLGGGTITTKKSIVVGDCGAFSFVADTSTDKSLIRVLDENSVSLENSIVFTHEPAFIDAANGNYALQATSVEAISSIGGDNSTNGRTTANLKKVLEPSLTAVHDEVVITKLALINDGNDPMFIPYFSHAVEQYGTIPAGQSGIVPLALTHSNEYLPAGDTAYLTIQMGAADQSFVDSLLIHVVDLDSMIVTVGGGNKMMVPTYTRSDTASVSLNFLNQTFGSKFTGTLIGGNCIRFDTTQQSHYVKNSTANTITFTRVYSQETSLIKNLRFGNGEDTVVIPAGDSVLVEFDFIAAEAKSYAIPVIFQTPNNIHGNFATVTFVADGIVPTLTLDPAGTLFFDERAKDSIQVKDLSIKNEQSYDITIESIEVSGEGFTATTTVENQVLAVGSQPVLVPIQFKPTGAGSHTGTVTVKYSGGSIATIALSGNGVAAKLSILNSNLDFGTEYTDQTISGQFTISNTNGFAFSIDSITSNDPQFTIVQDLKNVSIAPSGTQVVTVNFSPTSSGVQNGTITVHFAGGTATIPVTGTGVVDDVQLSESVLDFGSLRVGQSLVKQVSINNLGSSEITIRSVESYEAGVFVIRDNPADSKVASGSSVTFDVQFVAQGAEYGNVYENVKILIKYIDGNGEVKSKEAKAQGTASLAPVATLDSLSHDTVKWSPETDVTLFATCNDKDTVGLQVIQKYQWYKNGELWDSVAVPTVKASTFAPGKYSFYVVVTDNEGDTVKSNTDSLVVLGGAPIVSIDNLSPDNVILRDGQDVTYAFSAYDSDDNATNELDGLVSFALYSTIDGLINDSTKSDTKKASELSLGTHGFYVMAIDEEGDTSYSDTITIPVQNSMGRAVIVTGTPFGETNYFFNNIAPNANIAFKRLEDRGYSREQIFYMNHVGWQSIDGDPMVSSDIVDTSVMTKEVLHNHLKAIAADIKKDIPLVIYLLGHGNANEQNAKFYLDDKDTSQYITPTLLNEWLNEFGDLSANKSHITVILDFCYSGGFINGLKSATQNRVVVTSASAGATAYFAHGKSFATTIFNETYRGRSLKACFDAAKLWSDRVAPGAAKANPLIDGNGDGSTNTDADFAIADEIFLGGAQKFQGLIAEIDSISGTYDEATTTTTVSAVVTGEVKTMMARIVKLEGDLGSIDMANATTFEMTAGDNNTWSGTYESLDADGKYLILVEGFDGLKKSILTQGYEVEIGSTALSLAKVPQKLFFHNSIMGGQTHLNFGLPRTTNVAIDIYDLRGRVIQQIRHEGMKAGVYSLPVNCMASGFYITRFVAGQQQITKKMLIQR